MGRPKKRAAPRIAQYVNRNFENLVLNELARVIKMIEPPFAAKKRGRQAHDARIIAFCLIWKTMFCLTYDGIESSVKMHSEILIHTFGVQKLPGHSVIHRGIEKIPMSYIRRVNHHLILRFRRRGMTVAVDSSGFSLSNSSKWFDIRIRRTNSRKDSMKLHIVIDVDTGIIHQFTITDWKRHDSKEFGKLVNSLPKIAKALGDKAYSSRKNCEIVAKRGGKPFLIFKENATGRSKGSPEWKISFQEYKNNPKAWKDIYHLRSLVESVFSSIKKRWNSHIASRKGWYKRRELALKVVCYNLKQVLYNQRAEELGIGLWKSLQ